MFRPQKADELFRATLSRKKFMNRISLPPKRIPENNSKADSSDLIISYQLILLGRFNQMIIWVARERRWMPKGAVDKPGKVTWDARVQAGILKEPSARVVTTFFLESGKYDPTLPHQKSV
jgi:hypothetical protein